MKSTIFVLLVSVFSIILYAQDSTQVSVTPPANNVIASTVTPPLSAVPSAQEITDFFLSTGKDLDPKVAVKTVSERGASAISGLREILFSERVRSSQAVPVDTGDSSFDFPQGRFYAVSALVTIGSDSAMIVLVQAAVTHKLPEIRAFALNAVAKTYYDKVRSEGLTPAENILDVLFRCADDPTYDGTLQKTVSQIASDGLVCWLGLDFGDPQFKEARIKAGGGQQEMAPETFRQLWWKENCGKLVWNKDTGHFEVALK